MMSGGPCRVEASAASAVYRHEVGPRGVAFPVATASELQRMHLHGRYICRGGDYDDKLVRFESSQPGSPGYLAAGPSLQVVIIKGTVEKLVGDAPQAPRATHLLCPNPISVCQGGLCIVRVLKRGDCEAMQAAHVTNDAG